MQDRWTLRSFLALLIAGLFAGAPPARAAAPAATRPATRPADAARELARRYGLPGWERVKRLDYTFNVRLPDRERSIHRAWRWWPKKGKAVLRGGDREVTIPLAPGSMGLRAPDAAPAELVAAHRKFINDAYWLLFPFQLVWSDPEVRRTGRGESPIAGATGPVIAARFPETGGYTPGDAYRLYLDAGSGLIREWRYLPGDEDAGKAMTWEKHRRLGPLLIALEHHGPEKRFRLWFSDVRARLEGRERVVAPAPARAD